MYELAIERGRVKVQLKAFMIGNDLCVIISGGDSPHIGAVTLSVPRASLSDPDTNSASTSVLTLLGHKEDEAARQASQMLASRLNKNVIVICGIHIHKITTEEIDMVMSIDLDIRTNPGLDVCEYPDSGKVNIIPYQEIYRTEEKVDYYLDEDKVKKNGLPGLLVSLKLYSTIKCVTRPNQTKSTLSPVSPVLPRSRA